jgi:hypothetical protein
VKSLILSIALLSACGPRVQPFSAAVADRTVTGTSAYPTAMDPARVGSYAGYAKTGAGYFYDEVLEYRVWLHPERGAQRLAGDADYFAAFAEYELAAAFSKANRVQRTLSCLSGSSNGSTSLRRVNTPSKRANE